MIKLLFEYMAILSQENRITNTGYSFFKFNHLLRENYDLGSYDELGWWFSYSNAPKIFFRIIFRLRMPTRRNYKVASWFCRSKINEGKLVSSTLLHMKNRMTKPKNFLTSGFSYQDIVARRSSRKTSYFNWKSRSYEDVIKIMIKSWRRNSRSKLFFLDYDTPPFLCPSFNEVGTGTGDQ